MEDVSAKGEGDRNRKCSNQTTRSQHRRQCRTNHATAVSQSPSSRLHSRRRTTKRQRSSRPASVQASSRYRGGGRRRGRWVAVPRTYTAAGNLLGSPRPALSLHTSQPARSPADSFTARPHISHLGTAAPYRHVSQTPRLLRGEEPPQAHGSSRAPGGVRSTALGPYGSSTPPPHGSTTLDPTVPLLREVSRGRPTALR